MSDFKIVSRPHKMLDWIENQCTDWAENLIVEHYSVEDSHQLTKEQIEEVIEELNKLIEYPGGDWLATAFRNVINSWEAEHDIYLI